MIVEMGRILAATLPFLLTASIARATGAEGFYYNTCDYEKVAYTQKAGEAIGFRMQIKEKQTLLKELQANLAKAAKTDQAQCHDEDGTCVATWKQRVEFTNAEIGKLNQYIKDLTDGPLATLKADIEQCKKDLATIKKMKPFKESDLEQIKADVVEGRTTREEIVERLHLCKTMALRFFNRDGVGLFSGPVPTIMPIGETTSIYHK
jgi:hypothetical protein